MKYDLPNILLNPNKYDYSLDDIEITYFHDAKKDLIKKYYNLVSKSIWKAILNNLKRRIELYGTNDFIDNLDNSEKNIYFKNSHTLTEKLSLLNNISIIKNCLKLNIISSKTYNVLNFFYWFHKNDSNEPILFEDIISIIILLEKNLFKLKIDYKVPEFYIQATKKPENIVPREKRRKDDFTSHMNLIPKRRKNDFINTQTKKVKKEDLFMMQKSSNPRRRKNDFMHLNEPSLNRRKDDHVDDSISHKRRKDDLNYEENLPKRRKNDLNYEENQFIPRKRRKDDYISNQTIPNPRRRRRDD